MINECDHDCSRLSLLGGNLESNSAVVVAGAGCHLLRSTPSSAAMAPSGPIFSLTASI